MRDNKEGQSAEPVANGAAVNPTTPVGTNADGSASNINVSNIPRIETDLKDKDGTPKIKTTSALSEEKATIDFDTMSKDKREQTDEELINNALDEEEMEEAQSIIRTRRLKEKMAKEEAEKKAKDEKKKAKKDKKLAAKAKRKEWRKNHRALHIIFTILFAAAVTGAAIGATFLVQSIINKQKEQETIGKYKDGMTEDKDELDDSDKFDYHQDSLACYTRAREILRKRATINATIDGLPDYDKYRANMDKVVSAQSDDYVKLYFRLTEAIILFEDNAGTQGRDVLNEINPQSLDDEQIIVYNRAMAAYYTFLGDSEEAYKWQSLYDKVYTNDREELGE